MGKTSYEQTGSAKAQAIIDDIFEIGRIGYVALNSGQEVLLRLAPGVVSKTTAETNFYEELLVNPTLLKLASQRGELDCGGLNYIAIGYGDFVQLIMLMKDGHISMGISRKANSGEIAEQVVSILEKHAMARQPKASWLFG